MGPQWPEWGTVPHLTKLMNITRWLLPAGHVSEQPLLKSALLILIGVTTITTPQGLGLGLGDHAAFSSGDAWAQVLLGTYVFHQDQLSIAQRDGNCVGEDHLLFQNTDISMQTRPSLFHSSKANSAACTGKLTFMWANFKKWAMWRPTKESGVPSRFCLEFLLGRDVWGLPTHGQVQPTCPACSCASEMPVPIWEWESL